MYNIENKHENINNTEPKEYFKYETSIFRDIIVNTVINIIKPRRIYVIFDI